MGVTAHRVDSLDRLLGRVKAQARSWMPVPVYRRLYESAAALARAWRSVRRARP
jgi:hypothetical protein